MSRRNREDAPDALFHITARVNWRFWHLRPLKNADALVDILADCLIEFSTDLIGFVVMSNHFHLVSRSPGASTFRHLTTRRTPCRHRVPWPRGHSKSTVLSQFMQRLMYRSSRRIQRQIGTSGHLWEQRYDSVRIRDLPHLIAALAYDHLNPVIVKEAMVSAPEEHVLSSAAFWTYKSAAPVPLLKRGLPFEATFDEIAAQVVSAQRNFLGRTANRDDVVEHVRRQFGDDCGSQVRT